MAGCEEKCSTMLSSVVTVICQIYEIRSLEFRQEIITAKSRSNEKSSSLSRGGIIVTYKQPNTHHNTQNWWLNCPNWLKRIDIGPQIPQIKTNTSNKDLMEWFSIVLEVLSERDAPTMLLMKNDDRSIIRK